MRVARRARISPILPCRVMRMGIEPMISIMAKRVNETVMSSFRLKSIVVLCTKIGGNW
jgi:hypothetical protein